MLIAAGAAGAAAIGDTLTVIQRPLVNVPAIVLPGGGLTIQCEAPAGASGWSAELLRGATSLSMQVLSSTYRSSALWWDIDVVVPAVPVYELYDLVVRAAGGIADTTRNAVQVIPAFKNDYYFIHITDTHCPTHLYYYQNGADTDSSELVDLREIINDVNIISPEFVLLTGDFINEGELEDYLDKRYFSRCQSLLEEFAVPVYLTAGNHDIGGWYDTPPPAGTARQTWWRFFGWERLNSPPAGAPARTQDYSFDYGPVHYTGLEAYNNYDNWRPEIYGSDSFTAGQIEWLADDLAASSGSSAHVLFYHSDFLRQINLSGLGVDMALSGHTHRDSDDYSHPYNVVTRSACDGARAYRLVRVSGGNVQPAPTISAGPTGANLSVSFLPANDGSRDSVTATITNAISQRFEHAKLRFLMPNVPAMVGVTGGTLLQVDHSGPVAVYYVAVDILASSSQTVTVILEPYDIEPPTVQVISPNGQEVCEIGIAQEIAWTAADNVGVESVSIVLSSDGGATYQDTLATGEADDGIYWWTPAGDTTSAARIKVIAYDRLGNAAEDASDADFEIRDATAGIPSHVVITGTSPNPFSQTALIGFGLPRGGLVEIDLFDVSGRYVANLARKECQAGYQTFEWSNNGTVGAGIYFIKLRLGSDAAARKAVIPK